jgi:hypothetical protein
MPRNLEDTLRSRIRLQFIQGMHAAEIHGCNIPLSSSTVLSDHSVGFFGYVPILDLTVTRATILLFITFAKHS